MESTHNFQDLITLFNECFLEKYNTVLVRGGEEPLYLPADENRPHHTLCFAHGFFASALHETAHWLIAGAERRKLVDFGYWYEPDGRTIFQQELFQRMEAKPQAMEWILSKASGFPFRISLDNLGGAVIDPLPFKEAITQNVQRYCRQGLPPRAEALRQALCRFYHTSPTLNINDFKLESDF